MHFKELGTMNDSTELATERVLMTTTLKWHGVVFVLLLASMVIHYRNFFFGPPIIELGDFAANALKITHAKSFDELYGNYSRWHFQHPGPAFFYWFALGEWLLYNLLPVFHSPHQAHVFFNLVLQTFFLTISFGILSQFARSSIYDCLIILVASIHFNLMPTTIVELWPPNQIICPLLSLIVCASAVSVGKNHYIPMMVLSACFLIHGHVAQPLFVLPIAGIALFSYYKWHRKCLTDKLDWLVAGSILLLFLLPIFLDILHGSTSNAAQILAHIDKHSGKSNGLAKSIEYLACFFLYIGNAEVVLNTANMSFSSFISMNISLLLFWSATVIIPMIVLFTKTFPVHMSPECKIFHRHLTGYLLLAILLTIKWGKMIDGEMYSFNAYINFALIALALVPAVFIITNLLQAYTRYLKWPLVLGSTVVIVTLTTLPGLPLVSQQESEPTLPEHVRTTLAASGSNPVLLMFDRENSLKAAGVAVLLQRAGVPFYVLPHFGYVFGDRYVLDLNAYEKLAGGINIWGIRYSPSEKINIVQLPETLLDIESIINEWNIRELLRKNQKGIQSSTDFKLDSSS